MNIIITGSNGQLGTELQDILASGIADIGPINSVYAGASVTAIDVETLDITDESAVLAFFKNSNFDLVINCAAFTNVDACEDKEELAYQVNAEGPANLAKACQKSGAKFVHVSTDYVFPGTDPIPRKESDPTGPISAYGRTKLAGEKLVAINCNEYFILRTAWLYSKTGKNFVKTILELGEKLDEITIVNDQLGNPTCANDLAYEILTVATTDNFGIYHCTNEGTCSWADFAFAIVELARKDCKVTGISSADYEAKNPATAKRPAYSSLENAHLAATIGNSMRPWREALENYFSYFI
ncbi:MAG: dTDP-4-dehydrorhamnose reductase [Eggerthellaceae bacterium]|nr:dTDP-4-dehydrorhamnose reductase [Eggerthellaceae bacterium]